MSMDPCDHCKIKKGSEECLKCVHFEPGKNSKFKKCSKNRSLWWECAHIKPEECKNCEYHINYVPDKKSTLTEVRRKYRRMIK